MHTEDDNKVCPKCGSMVMPQDKVCSNCGEKLDAAEFSKNSLICRKCGVSLQFADRYCFKCGTETDNGKHESSLTCPECSAPIEATDKFCINCGTRLSLPGVSSEQNCPTCGNAVLPYDRFCINCGKKLELEVKNVGLTAERTHNESVMSAGKSETVSKEADVITEKENQDIPNAVVSKTGIAGNNFTEEQSGKDSVQEDNELSRPLDRAFVGLNLDREQNQESNSDVVQEDSAVDSVEGSNVIITRSNPFSEESSEHNEKYERARRASVGDISSKYIISNNFGGSSEPQREEVEPEQAQNRADGEDPLSPENDTRFIISNNENNVNNRNEPENKEPFSESVDEQSSLVESSSEVATVETVPESAADDESKEEPGLSENETEITAVSENDTPADDNKERSDSVSSEQGQSALNEAGEVEDRITHKEEYQEKTADNDEDKSSEEKPECDAAGGNADENKEEVSSASESETEGKVHGEHSDSSLIRPVIAAIVLIAVVGTVGLNGKLIKDKLITALTGGQRITAPYDEDKSGYRVLKREDNILGDLIEQLENLRVLTREDNVFYTEEDSQSNDFIKQAEREDNAVSGISPELADTADSSTENETATGNDVAPQSKPASSGDTAAQSEPAAGGDTTAQSKLASSGDTAAQSEPAASGDTAAQSEHAASGDTAAQSKPAAGGDTAAQSEPAAGGDTAAQSEPAGNGDLAANSEPSDSDIMPTQNDPAARGVLPSQSENMQGITSENQAETPAIAAPDDAETVTEFDISSTEPGDSKEEILNGLKGKLYYRNGLFFSFDFEMNKVLLFSESYPEVINVTNIYGNMDDGYLEFSSGKGRTARQFRLELKGAEHIRLNLLNGHFVNGDSKADLTFLRDFTEDEQKKGEPVIGVLDKMLSSDWESKDGKQSLKISKEQDSIVLSFSDRTITTKAKAHKNSNCLFLLTGNKKESYVVTMGKRFEPQMSIRDPQGNVSEWISPNFGD